MNWLGSTSVCRRRVSYRSFALYQSSSSSDRILNDLDQANAEAVLQDPTKWIIEDLRMEQCPFASDLSLQRSQGPRKPGVSQACSGLGYASTGIAA